MSANTPSIQRLFLSLSLGLSMAMAVGAGCHTESEDNSPEMRSADLEEGIAVSIELPADTARESIHEIAKHVEHGIGGDIAGAKVAVKKTNEEGPMTVVIELWGADLPDGDELEANLKSKFDFLADASIAVEQLDADAGPSSSPGEVGSDAEDPEVAKREIIDQLREQGVEGDVDVQVHDGPDGRRIEVKVEKEDGE